MTRIAEIADRLRRLAKRRENEGIYTDAALCEEAATLLEGLLSAIGAGGQAVDEDARDALRELANVKMDISLEDWCRISNTILSALSQPHAADERVVEARDGAAMIAVERRRQIEEEGWTAEHDDAEHHDGELGRAAAAYALSGIKVYQLPVDLVRRRKGIIADIWPWGQEWFKPRGKPDAVIRCLVKAGALIAAEIDQRQRRSALSAKEGR